MIPKSSQESFVRHLTNSQPALYAYILALVPDRHDASDILQDTNLVLWRRWEEYQEGTNFLAWAYRIARYKVLAHHRDRLRDRHIFDNTLFNQLADQVEHRFLDPETTAAFLEDCVEELPLAQRELIRERYGPGGSVQAIAQRLGRSVASISVTLSRIRHALLACVRRKLANKSRQ